MLVRLALPILLTVSFVSGCGDAPTVDEYEAPHGESDRMLTAIVPGGDRIWFFKVAGPREIVTEHADSFRDFLKSVSLDEQGQPTWKLPNGWLQKDGPQGRYKTLVIDSSPETLEVSVTKLTAPPDDQRDSYLAMNVNRWRGQMSLDLTSKVTEPEIRDYLQPLEPDSTILLVDLLGRYKTAKPASTSAHPMQPPIATTPQSPLKYKVPESWQQGRLEIAGIRREAAFEVPKPGGEPDEKADISVTIAMGSTEQNIARWMRQVGLTDTDANSIQSKTTVGGKDGILVDAKGSARSVVGVIAVVDDVKWFFKLSGPNELVDPERERFREFLDSVEFP
ncbi:MAG: hypothetical protein O3A00_11250 [Planctomycetota bacterium]|nr:hypothetical protein [Planctomycetota bacterium]